MAIKTIPNNERMAKQIRERRKELNLTIEEAAKRAGVGIKTWCRYEAGEAIREDKYRGILKALNWHVLPDEDNGSGQTLKVEDYREKREWPDDIAENYGDYAALSFVVGSELLLDDIAEDLRELSTMPAGTHLGQLPVSLVADYLPPQFLMRYDYEFMFIFQSTVQGMLNRVKHGTDLFAGSVMEEVALFLIVEEASIMLEMELDVDREEWTEWIYDVFTDADVLTWLYSDFYVKKGNPYHFDHWLENQFV